MRIEVFPSKYGDCFLITINKKHILIDCGFVDTYTKYLKPRLEKINKIGECIDLLVITHIHSDHILGINQFLKENGDHNKPNIIPIKEIWFNGFKHVHLQKRLEEELEKYTQKILEKIQLQGYKIDNLPLETYQPISGREAISITELIIKNSIPWNTSFSGEAVLADSYPKINLHGDISLILLSPTRDTLTELDKEWLKSLKRQKSNIKITENELFDKTFEYILSQEKEEIDKEYEPIASKTTTFSEYPFKADTSIVNKSSIAFILEYQDKKVLFLGDSHSSDIEKGLDYLLKEQDYNLTFDLIKLSHHGSQSNTSPDLLKLLKSKKYLISTNGDRYNHPDIQTIARILANADHEGRELIFNYDIPIVSLAIDKAKKIKILSPNQEQIIEVNL